MPIDLSSIFNRTTNSIANKSMIGYVIGHPLWFAVVIVVVILFMLWMWGIGDWDFKFLFYLTGITAALMVGHDIIVSEQIKETVESRDKQKTVSDLRNFMDLNSSIAPRTQSDAEILDNL